MTETEKEAKRLYCLLRNYNPHYPMGAGQYLEFCRIMERLERALGWAGMPFARQHHPDIPLGDGL